MVGRQVGLGLRQHGRRGRDRRGRHRLRRGLPARAVLPAGLRPGVRAGIAELGPHLLGEDPRELAHAEPPHGRGAQGPPLREVGDRHGLLGHPRQGRRACRSARCWAAASARLSSSTARSRRRAPAKMAASVAGYRAEGYRRFQLKVGGDPDVDIAAHPRRAREAAAGRRAGRRRQHRLADARGDARGAGGARRRRLHRAALPDATRSAWRCAGTPTIRSCSTR